MTSAATNDSAAQPIMYQAAEAATPVLRASSAATTGASPLKNVKLRLNDSATPEKRMRVGKRSAAIAMTVPAQIAPTTPTTANSASRLTVCSCTARKNGHESKSNSVVPVSASALRE